MNIAALSNLVLLQDSQITGHLESRYTSGISAVQMWDRWED
mgnify:CR=1 FL=1